MAGLINAYEQLMILLAILLVGFAMKKKGLLRKDAVSFLTEFVLNVAFPAVTVTSMMLPMTQERRQNTILLVVASVILYGCYVLIARVLASLMGRDQGEKRVYEFATIFSNSGYMGVPVMLALFGKEAIYYLMIYGIVYNLLFYTYGMRPLSEEDGKQSFREFGKNFLNLGVLSTLVGLLLCIGNITLPEAVTQGLDYLGATCTPLSMIILGAMMAEFPLREVLLEKRAYLFAVIRLVGLPLLTWGILRGLLQIENEWVLTTAVLVAGMPAASGTAMLAEKLQTGEKVAMQLVMVTTLLCCITLPILVSLLQ